jgi:TIR domain
MTDVFISYASADRGRAKILAESLAGQGWSIWWDRTIPPGRAFDEVIEEALDAAKCVVVLWSAASVASSWVKNESAEAMQRRILVPVLIEPVKIPLEFRRLQAADLSGWNGTQSDPQFMELSRAIQALAKRGTAPKSESGRATPGPATRPPPVRAQVERTETRRPSVQRHSKATLAAVAGVVLALLAVAYVTYDTMNERIAAEQEARRQAEENAAEAARREAAQRQKEEDRRAKEAAAASARIVPAPRPQTDTPPRASAAPPIQIRGSWRDTTWGHVAEFVQSGDTFRYTSSGIACRGSFRASGAGSIQGTRVEVAYRTTMPSEGHCTGTISPDGTRMTTTCVDSVCGQFVSYSVRQ